MPDFIFPSRPFVITIIVETRQNTPKYDKENKIDKSLPILCSLLKDDKPTTVRVCLSSIKELVQIKPNLKKEILPYLDNIDLSKYKESMSHLIEKDIVELKSLLIE